MHFVYNNVRRKKDNFDSVLKSIKMVLNMWKWRGLTLIGRIQIVKSFATPKIMSLIPVSSGLIKEVNKELFFSYRAAQLWNDLPEILTNIVSFNVFKNAIKRRALDEFLSHC